MMNRLHSRLINLFLIGFSGIAVFCPGTFTSIRVFSDATRPQIGSNPNLILFKRGPLDTEAHRDLDTSLDDRRAISVLGLSEAKQTRVVQFGGPIQTDWFEALQATGAQIIGYVANNSYIVHGSRHELARVAQLDSMNDADQEKPIRWMGRLQAVQKIDPAFSDDLLLSTGKSVDVEVELIDTPDSAALIETITAWSSNINREPRRFLNFVVLSVTVDVGRLIEIADHDQVLFAGPAPEMRLHDERGAQIIAGNLTADGTKPNGPGFIAWLASKGLDGAADYAIDIADSGIDRGSTDAQFLHPDFLTATLQSRLSYSVNYATDGLIDDKRGHGTIVASAAAGRGLASLEDVPGYMYGAGVDPNARLGASRIFNQNGKLPAQLSFTSVASAAYAGGARISNNSWGNSSNSYDASSQEYDSLVRDAQPSSLGNQQMSFVFSAGNLGPGGYVSSPGTAKNVISVGASENYRPEGTDACNLDGQGSIGPDGANNVRDILRYSSGGPTFDGRAKPDLCAPGTHIFGAASQTSGFFGDGLCAGAGLFQPPNQTLYTWSSGTSLAAPHVSGAASLVRRYIATRNLLGDHRPPSPAMVKAYLLNSASFLTGENAGGNLPGDRQGWGLPNLSRAFDNAKRELIDQTTTLTATGQTFELHGSIADRSLPLRVTLVWTDAPGSLVGPAIVNDLDLEITVGGVTVYRGNRFAGEYSFAGGDPDRINNVESIYLPPDAIPAGVEGEFKITVRAANIVGDGVPGNETALDQDFALVVYNVAPLNTPPPPPPPPPQKVPAITNVTYVKKTITITGRDFTAAAQVEVNGRVIQKPFEFDTSTNSLSLRLKPFKLNLVAGDNQIVLIENGQRSSPFVLVF
ncbi:MAG TPA: S8 family serine peptidase [Blastocatellia bacterium]|nr:S8 family serine peptidase [Blastocatellia bacterium]